MARTFEGTCSLIVHPKKGISLKKGGVIDADFDMVELATAALKAAKTKKVGLDKWSFYVEGESQKLDREEDQLPASVLATALDSSDFHGPELEAAKWGQPRFTLRRIDSQKKAQSKFETLL